MPRFATFCHNHALISALSQKEMVEAESEALTGKKKKKLVVSLGPGLRAVAGATRPMPVVSALPQLTLPPWIRGQTPCC